MSDVRTIRVCIASPSDLAVERRAFKEVLDELNAGFGDGLNIKFEPLGWEDTLASTEENGRARLSPSCDVGLRFDSKPGSAGASPSHPKH